MIFLTIAVTFVLVVTICGLHAWKQSLLQSRREEYRNNVIRIAKKRGLDPNSFPSMGDALGEMEKHK